jgi:hypothetical protein
MFEQDRKEDIEDRLILISKNEYVALIDHVFKEEFPRKTRCDGLSWMFPRDELVEICEVG